MQLKSFVFNPFQENTYVFYDETKECIIVDPGCCDQDENDELVRFIEHNKLNVKMLLNTHGHIDHVLGNYFVKTHFDTKLYIHKKDEQTLRAASVYAPNYGFHQYQPTEADGYLQEEDPVQFGNQHLQVLFVPGHAPGHVAFYNKASRMLIGGDVLFLNSIGRTDLPGGNFETLITSIHQKFFTLPNDVVVFPGHGPETTIGYEKKTNPFCALTDVNS